MKRVKALARSAALFLLRMLLVFIAVEGLASVVILGCKFAGTIGAIQAGGRHAQYDPEIGWVNLPGYHQNDVYGPGGHVNTNARGYRARQEFGPIPPNKLRVVCSGDSFTFGYGVGDDDPFCQALTRDDPRFETANLGIPGYGVDQAYLLYRREAPRLPHDIHLFSFIREDFKRMSSYKFLGVGKPVVRARAGAIEVDNVPVPRAAYTMPRLMRTLAAFQVSRVSTLYQTWKGRPEEIPAYRSQGQMMDTGLAVLEDLNRMAARGGGLLVTLYLPTQDDLDDPPYTQSYLRAELGKRGVVFLDLSDDFKALPPAERQAMFIPRAEKNEQLAAGHYSVNGNRFVAGKLRERLVAIPAIAERLARLAP